MSKLEMPIEDFAIAVSKENARLNAEIERLREALRDNETFVKTWSDEYDAMKAEIERLRAALKDAGESLEWAARRLNDNCASKADVMAVHFAAGQTTKARSTGGQG